MVYQIQYVTKKNGAKKVSLLLFLTFVSVSIIMILMYVRFALAY
jgi:hypothetical protein